MHSSTYVSLVTGFDVHVQKTCIIFLEKPIRDSESFKQFHL